MNIDRRLFLGSAAPAALLSKSVQTASETFAYPIFDRFAREHAFSRSVSLARRGRIIHHNLTSRRGSRRACNITRYTRLPRVCGRAGSGRTALELP